MDLWVVAAATAVGYVAKYWQNISKGIGVNSAEPYSPNTPSGKMARQKKLKKEAHSIRRNTVLRDDLDTCQLDGHFYCVEGTSYLDSFETRGDSSDPSTSSGLIPRTESEGLYKDDVGDYSLDRMDVTSLTGSLKNRTFLGKKHCYGHLVKHLSSMENCLVAQMGKEPVLVEGYASTPFTLPYVPTMRPLIVTDGNRVISRNVGLHSSVLFTDQSDNKLYSNKYPEVKEAVCSIPQLPKIESFDLVGEFSSKKARRFPKRTSSSSKLGSGKQVGTGDQNDAAVFLCFGICVGVLSSLITSEKEVKKLKAMLHQTEDLVQDLHEELEMQESLIVKEVVSERPALCNTDISSHDRAFTTVTSPKDSGLDNESRQRNDVKSQETLQPTNNIESDLEAELEAELERLELSISTSGLEGKLSDITELDPDLVADFSKGELQTEKINGQCIARTGSNQDSNSSDTTPPFSNYAVSPYELTLRLHEVVQVRLEEQVKELETALLESQRKLRNMELERNTMLINYWDTRERRRKPVTIDDSAPQPLVMNLSGEALDAYQEACYEFMNINDSEEESSELDVQAKSLEKEAAMNESSHWNGSFRERSSGDVMEDKVRVSVAEAYGVPDFLDVGPSEDENSEVDDEMEKLLIKQIVEKTKQGSPVVLNAQKLLFLMEDDEH